MNDTQNTALNTPSHVVGIGASAGGLEALQAFFSGVHNDTGAAYVVVQHLSPDYKSMMSELLKKHTEMPIYEVEDSIIVEANCIYLMPPRKNMLITEGKLLLSDQMPDGRPHMSIDVFLRSLAEDQQHRGIGIVLSGTGTDGTRGIRAMKESGGLVVVQKPDSAKFDGMPKNAFNTGLVDMVLTPEEMGDALVKFISHPYISGDTPVIQYANPDEDNDVLAEIFTLLKAKSSINFSQYKPTTVARRIERRLGINQLTTLEEYLALLIESPRELQILSKELLIGVTRFFRDTEAFEKLQLFAVKRIIANTKEEEPIRIWIAGCSSGEEAYSIAIMFNEALKQQGLQREVKIFATDVDEDAITEASTGTYSAEIAQDISEERLEKYFTFENGVYTVKAYLRQMVIFAQHNMIEDPPFSNVALVSCRNALIYFQQSAQKKVLTSFHFALAQGGILFLGNSESLGDIQSYFEVLDERNKVFVKASTARIPFSSNAILDKTKTDSTSLHNASSATGFSGLRATRAVHNDKFRAVREKLISHYAPECVVLNEDFEAMHVYGDVSRYVVGLKHGKVSTNIKDMIKEDLGVAVSTALYRCEKNEEDVYYKDVAFDNNGKTEIVDLAVFVVKQSEHQNSPRSYVLQFIEPSLHDADVKKSQQIVFDASEQSKQRIDDLEQELVKKQEHLQVTVEELETTNEELQSANEELMSANEELQSTNEELQSVNEELYTVNSEYQEKIRQLTEANADLDNVINSTDIGILFLDENLTIRKFTPHVTHYINVRVSDIGRPIHHISHELKFDDFLNKIGDISKGDGVFEQDIFTKDGQATLLKMSPYAIKEMDEERQGVMVTITNISKLKFVENALEQAKTQFNSSLLSRADRLNTRITQSKEVSILVLDDDSVFCQSTSRMLESELQRGFSVATALSLDEALGIMKHITIDLLLLDYQLSAETAEDVVAQLKDKNINVPVILLTSQDQSIMDTNFLNDEVIDVISKDHLSRELLARSIDYALERLSIKTLLENIAE